MGEQAMNKITSGVNSEDMHEIINSMSTCFVQQITPKIEELRDEIQLQASIRTDLALKWENYTCADLDAKPSESIENITWTYNEDRKPRKVQKLFDRDASKVYTVKNFISFEECKAMETEAAKTLHVATVADGSGGSHVVESRKAMQAGIKVPWHKEATGDHIANLSRRVYDFTNDFTGYDLRPDGQEDLMSIQYFGENFEKGEAPDRYMPHCDGDCDGMQHRRGNRVATMVMYCEIPEIGGATQFSNAGLHIKPEIGMATFFSYMGSDRTMDKGFTQHSGCPVLKGNKKIVTQWMRHGVDNENPWSSFNTLGVQSNEED